MQICIRYVLIFLSLCINAQAVTITSTTTGGSWEDASAWVGGVVPNELHDVVINGTVSVTSSNSSCNNLTINQGKVLQNGGSLGWVTLHVNGSLVNNGSIRNNPNGYNFCIESWKDFQNNGEVDIQYLYLPAKNIQNISQAAGKFFNADVRASDASGYGYTSGSLKAASDLTFKKSLQLTGYITGIGAVRTPIDMSGYNLTIAGEGELYNTTVKNTGSITTLENARLRSSSFEGNTSIKGTGRVNDAGVTFLNNLVVADTLQNGGSLGWLAVHIEGSLTNNGVIKNNWAGNSLQVEVWGNVHNNGAWTNSETFLPAKNIQYISQSEGKYFDCEIHRSDASGYGYTTGNLIASSALTFNKAVHLDGYVINSGSQWGTFDFANNNMNLHGDAVLYNAVIKNVNYFTTLDNAYIYNCSFEGNTSIKGRGRIDNSSVSFTGTLIIVDTLQNGGSLGWLTPIVYGDVINYGVVKNNWQGNSLCLDVRGSIYNYGYWNIWQTLIRTEGVDRYISGTFNTSFYMYKSGTPAAGDIYVDGSLTNENELIFKDGIQLIVPPGASLINRGGIKENGTVINNGTFTSTHNLQWNDPLNSGLYAGIELIDRKSLEKVTVEYYSNTIHPQMSSSTGQWWRITPTGETGSYKLSIKYDPGLLNGMDPGQVEVFLSPDSGLSWIKISTPLNITRDLENNLIIVGTNDYPLTSGFGDIILSTGGTIPVPDIASAIGGRSQIRVGPPNRYTVSYWNNGDTPTDMFCYHLQTNSGIHIKSIITKETGTDETVEIPIDSLNYDGNKDEAILFVQPLAPDEVRSFDVILTADPDIIGKQREVITFTAVALWVGGAILEEYISNTMVEGCYEMWRPVQNDQALTDASVNCLKNSMKKAVTVENGAKGVAKKAAEEIIKKTGRVTVWPVMLAKDIFECMGNAVKGMKDYVNGNFDKQDKELTKVTSWDPNAKEGPEGYSDMGYLASSAPMLYTIFFENKKEATAPAYQITIYDTLDQNVYDVSTLQFLEKSHDMGTAVRQGNILKWEFTGIELVPNVNPPEGEGWVKFIVHPKSNLPTGTVLQNKADIKFDSNPWLATNVYTNTLDFEPPVTTPASLTRLPSAHEVEFAWIGNDGNGSGVGSTTVYMSINDGPYTVAASTGANSVTIPISGEDGYKYKFYALSKDNAGNSEKEPAEYMEILTDVKTDYGVAAPLKFALRQNYPNPFNPVTTVCYELPEKGNVKLMIYNLLGEVVSILVDEEKSAGYYDVVWNASDCSSGVYFCKISYNGKTFVNKMMLLK
jgi:hypothetical protein